MAPDPAASRLCGHRQAAIAPRARAVVLWTLAATSLGACPITDEAHEAPPAPHDADARIAAAPPDLPPAPPASPSERLLGQHPARLAQGGPERALYATDPASNALLVYDSTLTLIQAVPDFGAPLGVAVNAQGVVFVGSRSRHTIETYARDGGRRVFVPAGIVQMPNDLAFDTRGNLWVVDSVANRVLVFLPDGRWLRSLGAGADTPSAFSFPVAIALSGRAVYIADQGHSHIQVFDLDANFLGTLGEPARDLGDLTPGRFARLQSLALDARGRLHALDSALGRIQVFDPASGKVVATYGEPGMAPGNLGTPLDILIDDRGRTLVADYGQRRITRMDEVR